MNSPRPVLSRLLKLMPVGLLSMFVLQSALAGAQTPTIKISGQVIGVDGKPAKDIAVGANWRRMRSVNRDTNTVGYDLIPSGGYGRTDSEGRFEVQVRVRTFPIAFGAYTVDNVEGVIISLSEEESKKPVTLKLQPLATVGVSKVSTEGQSEFEGSPAVAVKRVSDGLLVGGYAIDPKGDTFWLMPGDYEFTFQSMDTEDIVKNVTVASADEHISLGEVELPPNKLTKNVGKPAPELDFLLAKGVPNNLKIGDLKGKWVVIEFWGHWCAPCVRGGIPHLMDFYEEYGDNEKVAVLALHYSRDVTTFEQLEEKTRPFVDQFWKGRELTFPVLIDNGGTPRAWGVRYFPTMLLVNPEGILLRGTQENFQQMVKEISE